MRIFLYITIISALTQFVIALFVLIQNKKNATNIIFSLLSLFLIIWVLLTFYFNINPRTEGGILIVRLTMATVVIQNTLFFFFGKVFPRSKINFSISNCIFLLFSAVTFSAALSPFLFIGLELTSISASPIPGPAMPVFLIHAIVAISGGFKALGKKDVAFNKSHRAQIKFIKLAAIVLWVVVPITNLIFTLVFKTLLFTLFSPIYSLAFSSVIAYAIVKQKLFDIRLIVARSVVYGLVLLTLSLMYSTIIFGLSLLFYGNATTQPTTQQLSNIALAVFLAFTFQYLKRFFDKLTSRVFFRDLYSSEEFLSALGKELSERRDLTALLQNSLVLVSSTLKANRASLIVLDKDQTRILKTSSVNSKGKSLPTFDMLNKFNNDLLSSHDEIRSDSLKYKQMEKYDLDIILRLGEKENVTGYLLLDVKSGGNSYTAQDLQVLEIASKQLAVAIQNARYVSQIAEFNKTLQGEIKRATSKLEKSNEKLRHLDEAKDEFVSMASHQLRTPLTTIKGYLSMLLEGDAGEITKLQQKFVSEAFTSTQRMVYLISDLLNVSRISTGKFVLNETTVDFAKIVEGEIAQMRRTAKTKNIKLEYKKPNNLPQLTLDKTKVSQVVMNFIDNALFYTPKNGKITVELSETNNYIELTVTDNGIGVPKFEQHQLFTKFFRAENAREARPDGTGLGLYMAKKVIIAQGGSIILESEEGKGSTFGFRFLKSKIIASKNT